MAFTPTRSAALQTLAEFVPMAGVTYARRRNYDLRPDGSRAVSQLSPYIRHRLISEQEVIQTTLARHSAREAEKFIQEVFWRTYWKGWLEMRPGAWLHYKQAVQAGLNRLQTEAGLRHDFEAACRGETEIDCFNSWAQELVNTGYLHNHARMWFASIWVFTLRLPWALGADFFLRHLLDGDPASNTLGWKWVAGLQTEGKTYLARPDNIAEFTENRFQPTANELAAHVEPPEPFLTFERQPLPFPDRLRPSEKSAVLLHEDDLCGGLQADDWQGLPVAGLLSTQNRSPLTVSEQVTRFAKSALLAAAKDRFQTDATIFSSPKEVASWAAQLGVSQLITPYAPLGPVSEALDDVEKALAPHNIKVSRSLRDYDRICWPHATKGFFPFKKNIPDFLNKFR
ncbi:MAG: FAD-binding domain-containing protein [Pseudomonadota bacterium]